MQVWVLIGSKKGAFILESDGARPRLARARTFLRALAADSCRRRRPQRDNLRDRRQRLVWSGSVEVQWTEAQPGPIRARGLRTRKARRRCNARGSPIPRLGASTSGSSRRGFSSAKTAAKVFARWRACGGIPRARSGNRAGSGWCSIPSSRTPPMRAASGSASPRSACSSRRTAAKRGALVTSGTRCDYLPEGERYPEFGQCVHNLTLAPGCIRPPLPAEPLRHVPQ